MAEIIIYIMQVFKTFRPSMMAYMQHRSFAKKLFVQGLPTDWDQNDIASRFSLTGTLESVNLVKNSMGQNSGKAVLIYEHDNSADTAIK